MVEPSPFPFPWPMPDLPPRDPFLRPDSTSYSDILTDAAVDLLREQGVSGLSVSGLARRLKMTPQAVLNVWPRARVIELLCVGFGHRWVAWSRADREIGLPAKLPRTADELHGVRVHLALTELARGEQAQGRSHPALKLARFAEEERWLLFEALEDSSGRPPTDTEVEATAALVGGLRLRLAAAETTLTWEVAADLLREHVARLVVDNQPREDT